MTKVSTIVALLALVSSPLAGQDTSSTQRIILQLEEQWRLAQHHNDTAAFRRLLAPDLTFIGTSGSFRDRADYIASRSASWIPRAKSFTASELRVRIYGATAIVTGREQTTGAGVGFSARFTDVWLRRRGRWQLVAAQRTDIAPPG